MQESDCFLPALKNSRWFLLSLLFQLNDSVPVIFSCSCYCRSSMAEGSLTCVFFFISSVCQFLARCQSPTGGFAGGPGQHAHLAPTYAAVNALCIIGTEEAYNVIDRCSLPPTSCMVVAVKGTVTLQSDVAGPPCLSAHTVKSTLKAVENPLQGGRVCNYATLILSSAADRSCRLTLSSLCCYSGVYVLGIY